MISNILSKHEFWNRMQHHPKKIYDFKDQRHGFFDSYFLPEGSDKKYRAALKKESLFRNICTVLPGPKGDSSIYVSEEEDVTVWVTPETQIQPSTAVATKIAVGSSVLSCLTKVDDTFVQDAQFDLESHLIKRLSKGFAKGEEDAFINGDGDHKPYGILDDTKGAEVGHTTAAIGYHDVVKLYFSVDKEFRENGCWLMNDRTAFALRALQDQGGSYIWNQASNTILGKPVHISNYMPDDEIGNKPIAFGDFSRYWIIDRLPVSVRPIEELFALQGYIGYMGYEYVNGVMITPEAIKVLKVI